VHQKQRLPQQPGGGVWDRVLAWRSKSSDEKRAASVAATFDLPIKLLQRYANMGILVEIRSTQERLRDAFVLIR
jgi:hypothetical protein